MNDGGKQVGTMLVTGAAGFLGAAVARRAARAGWRVVATGRGARGVRLAPVACEWRTVDMHDHDAVAALVAEARPDVVVHTAWSGVAGAARADRIQLANVTATAALADAAGRAGARQFIGIGSQAEYGPVDGPVTEARPTAPTTLYGAAKLSAAHLSRVQSTMAGMTHAWLRLFAIYGPGDNANWLIPSLAAAMARGECPPMTPGTQRWDYLYIDDAADAVLALAARDVGGTFNLASGSSTPVRAIAEAIRDRVAPGLPLAFGTVPFAPTQIMHLEGDIAALIAATGWRPRVPLSEGLDRSVGALAHAA